MVKKNEEKIHNFFSYCVKVQTYTFVKTKQTSIATKSLIY